MNGHPSEEPEDFKDSLMKIKDTELENSLQVKDHKPEYHPEEYYEEYNEYERD